MGIGGEIVAAKTKYTHIKNEELEQLLARGMKVPEIARFYGVGHRVVRNRKDTIDRQKQSGKWYKGKEPPKKKKPKLTGQYTPIWELPKACGEVKTYRMDMAAITERYGRPGENAEPIPAHLWNREVTVYEI